MFSVSILCYTLYQVMVYIGQLLNLTAAYSQLLFPGNIKTSYGFVFLTDDDENPLAFFNLIEKEHELSWVNKCAKTFRGRDTQTMLISQPGCNPIKSATLLRQMKSSAPTGGRPSLHK